MSTGGVSGTTVDPKLIFTAALKTNASSILISHNHPSGALQPSKEDIQMTKELITAGKALGILLLDHLIVTSEGYYSFAEEGQF